VINNRVKKQMRKGLNIWEPHETGSFQRYLWCRREQDWMLFYNRGALCGGQL